MPEIPWVNMLIGPRMVEMAAFIVLGLWIVFQLISGVGTVACTDESADTGGAVRVAGSSAKSLIAVARGLRRGAIFGSEDQPPPRVTAKEMAVSASYRFLE